MIKNGKTLTINNIERKCQPLLTSSKKSTIMKRINRNWFGERKSGKEGAWEDGNVVCGRGKCVWGRENIKELGSFTKTKPYSSTTEIEILFALKSIKFLGPSSSIRLTVSEKSFVFLYRFLNSIKPDLKRCFLQNFVHKRKRSENFYVNLAL